MYITLGDKHFKPLISKIQILDRIRDMAIEINQKFESREIEILVVLEGARTLSNIILPLFSFPYKCHFITVKTYEGMQSNSTFDIDVSWFKKLKSKEVLILEDIIDSGFTAHKLIEALKKKDLKTIHLATLLLKPQQLKYPINPDFTGFEIEPEFVVGFGMDYNELGRDLSDIYCFMNP